MRRIALISFLLAAGGWAVMKTAKVGRQPDGSYLIPTGQTLTPAGEHVEVNDRPLGMALSPDGATLAVVTGSNFAPRALHLVDWKARRVAQTLPTGGSFVGVAYAPDGGTLYVGGAQSHEVRIYRREAGGGFSPGEAIAFPGAAPMGLAVTPDGKALYVGLNLKHAVARVDLATRAVTETEVGAYPYGVAIAGNGKVYVSNWGGRRPRPGDITDGEFPVALDPRTGIPWSGTVSVLDAATGKLRTHIDVGLHPSGMASSPAGGRLYVANANSDTVSAIDTAADRAVRPIEVRLFRKAPLGSTPNALAVSPDGKTLYVANAANNAVAVVDAGQGAVRGFIPTGWYPTAVALAAGGRQLCVASGYGFGSVAPAKEAGRTYRDRAGVVSMMAVPDARQLRRYSAMTLRNNNVVERRGAPAGPEKNIRHVFYVIKENRTYDQVFGDLPQGNGDPRLVHFGRDVTPNHHALAERYVLLDNFYAPGDQSALGHRWCTQGYAGDYVHKFSNARNDQNPMLFAPTDFLWDHAKANGVSVRSYGERGRNTITPPNATWRDIYEDWRGGARRIRIEPRTLVLGLKDVYAPRYPAYELRVPDQVRIEAFLEEFHEFEKNGNLPRLVVLLLPQDHTGGTAPQYPTPRAMVADNDLALGRLVEAVSKSRYWKESVILVTEDDAQNGLDHVDGHRTVGLVIGPWVKRGVVDSTMYTIINMFRTVEHILGLAPLNQFDLAAEPMFSVFTNEPDTRPYEALKNRVPLDEMNRPLAGLRGLERRLAEESMRQQLDEPDAAEEETLNRAVWHAAKGFGTPYPHVGR